MFFVPAHGTTPKILIKPTHHKFPSKVRKLKIRYSSVANYRGSEIRNCFFAELSNNSPTLTKNFQVKVRLPIEIY